MSRFAQQSPCFPLKTYAVRRSSVTNHRAWSVHFTNHFSQSCVINRIYQRFSSVGANPAFILCRQNFSIRSYIKINVFSIITRWAFAVNRRHINRAAFGHILRKFPVLVPQSHGFPYRIVILAHLPRAHSLHFVPRKQARGAVPALLRARYSASLVFPCQRIRFPRQIHHRACQRPHKPRVQRVRLRFHKGLPCAPSLGGRRRG